MIRRRLSDLMRSGTGVDSSTSATQQQQQQQQQQARVDAVEEETTDPRGPPPKPGQGSSWAVEKDVVDAGARQVPTSPDDVDETTRLVLQSRLPDSFVDFDVLCLELAKVLSALPSDATLTEYKWVFWTDNPLGQKLVNLAKALSRDGGCLIMDEQDFKFRRRAAPSFLA